MEELLEKFITVSGVAFLMILIVAGMGVLFAIPTQWLWNNLIPSIFQLREITFLEAWGLLILSALLVKSTTGHSSQ